MSAAVAVRARGEGLAIIGTSVALHVVAWAVLAVFRSAPPDPPVVMNVEVVPAPAPPAPPPPAAVPPAPVPAEPLRA